MTTPDPDVAQVAKQVGVASMMRRSAFCTQTCAPYIVCVCKVERAVLELVGPLVERVVEQEREAHRKLIRAWESLPGGERYDNRTISEWLLGDMAPAINMFRARSAEPEHPNHCLCDKCVTPENMEDRLSARSTPPRGEGGE
jgi:hypothetical protein